MKRWLAILALLAGLGSSISFAQVASQKDPFSRYMAGIKAGSQELSLNRFATECGVDVSKIQPQFAAGPGSSLTLVRDLAKGLRSLATDFYSTAEVWVEGERVLVEMWANSDDVGSEARYYKCFANRKLLQAEVIEWNVPVDQSPNVVSWGYSRRWERGASGRMQRTKAEFVDEMERPIPKPKLDEDGEKSLHWIPPLGPLSELKLPSSMLR
ncbi:MAG TPA: hypothetical protein VKF63_04520 [Terracidiphilus sp.]|nr:hypothetical protein [Terracidiphilus sp.]